MPQIDEMLKTMAARGASDLHMTSGFKPFIRDNGDIVNLEDFPLLTPELNRQIIYEIMPPHNLGQFEETWDTDFSYPLEGTGRFRVNVFMDRFGIGAVLRIIPTKLPTFEQLGLPRVIRDFCFLSKGLILVTGPTGSGKSTTLAAMIDFINRNRTEHVITIEDPIEFVHEPNKCLLNQREVHSHTKSFPNALRAALREDPDIVLVGEMRDLETMEIAIETAETGHLVFGTLHTNTAASTVDRMIDKFPADRQNQIRTMLASSLKGVVAQTLCKKKGGGRVAAFEILVCTNAVSANIRDGKSHMLPSAMQIGKNVGMQLFNDALFELVVAGQIEPREAWLKSVEKDGLVKKLNDNGYAFDPALVDQPWGDDRPLTPERAAEYETTIRELAAVIARDPNHLESLYNLAWIHSTSPSARYRNGAEAVRLAERANAITQGGNAQILDTLGTSYAEARQFDKALASARRGLQIAQAANDARLIHLLTKSITNYEQGLPVRIE